MENIDIEDKSRRGERVSHIQSKAASARKDKTTKSMISISLSLILLLGTYSSMMIFGAWKVAYAEGETVSIFATDNPEPRWDIDFVTIFGSSENAAGGDFSVSVDWDDGSDPSVVPISDDGSWTAETHLYGLSAIGTRQIVASVINGSGSVFATSEPFPIVVRAHTTQLTLNPVLSVLQGTEITASGILIDLETGGPVGDALITFSDTGSSGLSGVLTSLDDGTFSSSGPAPSEQGDAWQIQAHFAGNDAYSSSDSEIRTFDTVESSAIKFDVPADAPSTVPLTGFSFDARITFDAIPDAGQIFVSECDTPDSDRYLSPSPIDMCLKISSYVEMPVGTFAHLNMSYAGRDLGGKDPQDIDLYYEDPIDGIVDLTEAKNVDTRSVKARIESFGKFIAAFDNHDPKPPASVRQQLFVGSNDQIVALGEITNMANQSAIATLDRSQYNIGDIVQLTINDPEANKDASISEKIKANVNSTSDHLGINIELTETGPDSGIFVGSFVLIDGLSSGNSLQINAGGAISVFYIQKPMARTAIEFDGIEESGIVDISHYDLADGDPTWNFNPRFIPIGGSVNLDIQHASFDLSSNIIVTMSYANAEFRGQDPAFFELMHKEADNWKIITTERDPAKMTITGATKVDGPLSIGTCFGCDLGGAGGGLGRPGAGIVVDFVASIKRPSSPTESGGSSGGGSRTVIVSNQPSTPTFPASYFAENPLARIQVKNVGFVDSAGASIFQTAVGQQLSIASTFTNHQQASQHYSFIVMILDEEGLTIDISSQDGTVESGQTVDLSSSWMSQDGGVYTIKVFVWDSIGTHPVPLSEVSAKNIRVVSS